MVRNVESVSSFDPSNMQDELVHRVEKDVQPKANKVTLVEEDGTIDYERIERLMARMLILLASERTNIYAQLSESSRKYWMDSVKENAGLYDWKKLNVTWIPLAKFAIEVASIATINTNPDLQNNTHFKELESYSKIAQLAKEVLDTLDQGKRTQFQSQSEISKLLFENNLNDQKNFDQQTAAAQRELDESIKRDASFKANMAAG